MKSLIGTVISDKMTKTAVVKVARAWMHPVYRKAVRRSKTYVADNELGAKMGEKVRLILIRPMSRRKKWQIEERIK